MTDPTESTDWRRFGRVMTALAVGAFAAYASYDHMRALALMVGQPASIARLLPFSVDGLIVFATFSMDGRNSFWPRLSFWLGVTATISANVLSARHDLLSQIVASWAPISLLCVIETWSRRNKTEPWRFRRRVAAETEPAEAKPFVSQTVLADEPKPAPAKPYVADKTQRKVAAAVRRNPDARTTEIAAKTGLSDTTVRRAMAVAAEPPVVAAEPSTEPVGAMA